MTCNTLGTCTSYPHCGSACVGEGTFFLQMSSDTSHKTFDLAFSIMNLVLSCWSLLTDKKLSYWPLSLSRETRQDTDSLHIRSVGFPFSFSHLCPEGKTGKLCSSWSHQLIFHISPLKCLKRTKKCEGPWKAPFNSLRGPEFGFAMVAVVAVAVVAGTLRRRPSRSCSRRWSVENRDWMHCPPSCARPWGRVVLSGAWLWFW